MMSCHDMTSSDQEQCVIHCHNVIQCHTHQTHHQPAWLYANISDSHFLHLTSYNVQTYSQLMSQTQQQESKNSSGSVSEIMATLTVSILQYPPRSQLSYFHGIAGRPWSQLLNIYATTCNILIWLFAIHNLNSWVNTPPAKYAAVLQSLVNDTWNCLQNDPVKTVND